MTRAELLACRDELVGSLGDVGVVMRGSLLERTVRHGGGCAKCARGWGHSLWVLSVNYPGGKNRQLSVHPDQMSSVRRALDRYQNVKDVLESISELNRHLLLLERDGEGETA
jgi:hypothetical protein